MSKLILILAVMFSLISVAIGDTWIHLATQSTGPTPRQLEQTEPPLPEQLVRAGWRKYDGIVPAIAVGYERLTGPVYVQDPVHSARCIATFADTTIQSRLDREAAQAAQAELERIARTNAEAQAVADLAAWRDLKDAVQAIDPSAIDKTPFTNAAQKATIQAAKDAVQATKQALKRVMDYVRP